jgi:hypothetical protein
MLKEEERRKKEGRKKEKKTIRVSVISVSVCWKLAIEH